MYGLLPKTPTKKDNNMPTATEELKKEALEDYGLLE